MQTELSDFTAIIGIDWADKKHDVCVQAIDSGERQFIKVPHQVDKIDHWARAMIKCHGGPMAVVLEIAKGPIVSALLKYPSFVLYPIHAATLATYRKAFNPSGAKDDPTDAQLLLDLLLTHPERFKPLTPQSMEMRKLTTLVEQRRGLIDDQRRLTNRLRDALKQYYPQALDWFDHIDTRLFCDFIRRWSTPVQVRRARRMTLQTFFHEHHVYRATLLERRITAMKSLTPLTTDEAVVAPYRLQALTLIDQLVVMLDALRQYDDEIAALAPQLPDYALFSCLPGAGPHLAPRLLVAFGEQRERFASAADIQKYAGIAPVTARSGQKTWVHWRWQCPKFLCQTFVEWAAQTINKSYWAGLYYYQQRAKGCSYQAAVRALAFKWIRILYRCWVTRTPYDEAKYLKALRDRGSPLLAAENA